MEGTQVTIENLNNDCLITVFRFLPIVDRIKIERVSRRWNQQSKSSWSNYKYFYDEPMTWGFKFYGLRPMVKIIETSMIVSVLKRCGRFLDHIAVHSPTSSILEIIGTYCQNIKIIDVNIAQVVNEEDFLKFSKSCNNIKKLSLCNSGDDQNDIDKKLSFLFKNNKNLTFLEFNNLSTNGSCLLSLPVNNLDTLNIERGLFIIIHNLVNAIEQLHNLKIYKNDSPIDEEFAIIRALQKCSNLEELELCCESELCMEQVDKELELLIEKNQKLRILRLDSFDFRGTCFKKLNPDVIEEIHLTACFGLRHEIFDYCLPRFSKLTGVSLSRCFYRDDFSNKDLNTLDKIIKAIGLYSLNLKSFEISSDEPFDFPFKNLVFISSLTNLEELSLKDNEAVTDTILINFSKNLKKLICANFEGCINISDLGLLAITSLPKLECLTVSHNEEITDKGFSKMLNLKKLDCTSCKNITVDGLKNIIRDSENLDYLCAEEATDAVDDLLSFVIDVTNKRRNNIILRISELFGNEVIKNYGMKDPPPFLQLIDYRKTF